MASSSDVRSTPVFVAPEQTGGRPGCDAGEAGEPRGGAAVPDHPTLRALLGALMSAGPAATSGGWRLADGCVQITQRVGFDPIRVRLQAADSVAAWREVLTISALALDVLAVVIDGFAGDGGEVRLVRCADILDAKGRRRLGEERQAQEAQVARELMHLGAFVLGSEEQPVFSVVPVGGDRPTSFVVSLDPQVRAAWADAPLRRVNWRLLQFDHRTNRGADVLAKKLGIYFSLAGSRTRPAVRSVRSVLKAVGAAGELAGGARGGRLADRFEEALLRLDERGLFAAGYRGGRVPGMEDGRMKGWVKRWLDTDLVIVPHDQGPSRPRGLPLANAALASSADLPQLSWGRA